MVTKVTVEGAFDDNCTLYRQYNSDSPISVATTFAGSVKTKTVGTIDTPNYHALKKCGKFLPLNPFLVQTVVETRMPMTGQVNTVAGPPGFIRDYGRYFSASWGRDLYPPVPDSALQDAAVLAAAANAASASFDLATWLAEFRKSVDTVASVGRSFNSLTLTMAKQASRFKRDAGKAFADLWLGARYAIRPMVYDALSATEAIHRLVDDITLIKGKGFQKSESDDEFVKGWEYVAPNIERKRVERLTTNYQYRGAAYIQYEDSLSTAVQANPLVTAWELVPYSFVVDWFINIGAYIQTLKPQFGNQYAGIQGSIRKTVTFRQEYSHRGVDDWTGVQGPQIWTITEETYERWPTSVPAPPVVIDLSLPQIVDLVALFALGRMNVNKALMRL